MTTIQRYLITQPLVTKAVVGIIQREQEILLGLRKQVTNGLGHNIIAGIGGKLDPGETNDEALIREIQEEISVTITRFDQVGKAIFLFPDHPKWNQEVQVYLIDEWQGQPRETAVMKPAWYKLDNLPKSQMWEDNLYWIDNAIKRKPFNMTFLFDQDSHIIEVMNDQP